MLDYFLLVLKMSSLAVLATSPLAATIALVFWLIRKGREEDREARERALERQSPVANRRGVNPPEA